MNRLFSADSLVAAVGGAMTRPFHATGVSIDSRTVAAGELFVALKTETGDGHAHVAQALEAGAAGALVHTTHGMPDGAPLLVVGDTLDGLTRLGAFARERFTGAVAAITGSVGKTTTKEMLRTALTACRPTHAAFASYNNHWGVPLTLARMAPDEDYAVLEIGMNHPGEIAPLARLAAPDVAVITTVEAAHIGHMGSLDAIAREKASIAEGVLQGGALVLPADSPSLTVLQEFAGAIKVLHFGARQIVESQGDAGGTSIAAEIASERVHFRLNVPGQHMVLNALAALTAAHALGADLRKAAAALEGFVAVGGRGVQESILGGRALLLDESYNASSASMRAALAVLKMLPAERRIAVLGDMLELGSFSHQEHAGLAEAVTDSADLLFACGPAMRALFDAMPAEKRGAYAEDSAALAPLAAQAARSGDAFLVKGSLGSRMKTIVRALHDAGEAA